MLSIGDAAGFLNVPKIKCAYTAMKSGMLAAKAIFSPCKATDLRIFWATRRDYGSLESMMHSTMLGIIRLGFQFGLWWGLGLAALDTFVFRAITPWTLHHDLDHKQLKKVSHCKLIVYPEPGNFLTFSRPSSIQL